MNRASTEPMQQSKEQIIAERDAAISRLLAAGIVMALVGLAAPHIATGFRFLVGATIGPSEPDNCPNSDVRLAPGELEIERRRCEAERAGAGRVR